MFKTISEVRQANKDRGHHFFSRETIKFFESKVESTLYKNQCFITSEKKCFNDYQRVYSIRRAKPNGSIETLERGLISIELAREKIKNYEIKE